MKERKEKESDDCGEYGEDLKERNSRGNNKGNRKWKDNEIMDRMRKKIWKKEIVRIKEEKENKIKMN